jgi:hypothetical protein
MPIDPLYSDSPLLQGSKTDGCPKTSTDVSYTSEHGEPVVSNISDKKICTSDMFKTDQFLENTSGCCVLADSELDCADVANVDAAEENNYYMGLRYSDDRSEERKICYTTPIRKKKLHIMDLLIKVLMDIIIFIVMVLVAACYEYWIIYGKCASSGGGIQTTLYDSPYNVGNHMQKDSISIKTVNDLQKPDCPDNRPNAPVGPGLHWFDTFPYNLISFLNTNKGYNGSKTDTSMNFALSELVKIPARSLLLGFFYCIIFSRIAMRTLIDLINTQGSYIYNKEPNKYSQFWSGLIFIFVFMGIYGAITDKYIVKLPYLNASSLFLLVIIIICTIWIPSLFSFFMMMLSYMGYRRGTYTKYKAKRKKETSGGEASGDETEKPSWMERFYQKFDYYLLIEYFFMLKKKLTSLNENEQLCKNDDKSEDSKGIFEINNEEDLDWFFPIRRSKIEVGWRSPWLEGKINNLWNFNFTKCIKDDDPEFYIGFWAKYYWYLSQFWKYPWRLVDPTFTLNVNCEEIEKSNAKATFWWWLFMIVLSFFFPQIRFYTFLVSIVFLIVAIVLVAVLAILWTSVVMIIAMYSIFIALLGNILALFYLHFYVIIGFFYVPFKHYTQLFKIIKSHGNILTLLFCMIVVLAGVNVLHPTSVGVIGGILGLVVLYKIITLLSV